jgi:hypothetical protein
MKRDDDDPQATLEPPSATPRTGGGQVLNLNVNTMDLGSASPVHTSGTTVRFRHLATISGLTPYRLEHYSA